MLAYATDGLWLEMAQTANTAAARLAAGLRQVPGARILHEPAGNLIYAELPRAAHARAFAAGAVYYLYPGDTALEGDPETPVSCRLVMRLVEDRGRGGRTDRKLDQLTFSGTFFRRRTRVFRLPPATASRNGPIAPATFSAWVIGTMCPAPSILARRTS
jgi:hypothetical protein